MAINAPRLIAFGVYPSVSDHLTNGELRDGHDTRLNSLLVKLSNLGFERGKAIVVQASE